MAMQETVSTLSSPFTWADLAADIWSYTHGLQTPQAFTHTTFGAGQVWSVFQVFRQDWGHLLQTGNWSPSFWTSLSNTLYSGLGSAVALQWAAPVLAGAVGVVGWPAVIVGGLVIGIGGAVAGRGVWNVIQTGMTQLLQSQDVGGILFENCDAVLTDIGEITGAYWDSRAQSLVLLGMNGCKEELTKLKLPTMDRDHLLVALRASLAGQPIGVSIDPPSEYWEGVRRGVTPPDGTPMLVSYLGNTEGTLFGAIMFEADRLLKCLDRGIDNQTQKPIRAKVPGFKTLLEMIRPGDGRPENVWHRFWFVIDKVELKHDPTSGAIAFGDVRLKVLTETERSRQSKSEYIDPADQAFVRHLTEYYDEYSKEFPILARLRELAKIAAVAKFLANQGIPIDIGSLFASGPVAVETPSSTPGISVTSPNVEVRHQGDVVHTRMVSLFGGVYLDAEPHVIPDDGEARRLRNMAESTRPNPTTPSWLFRKNGTIGRAIAARIGQEHKPFTRICEDHEFAPGPNGSLLQLRRLYSSKLMRRGEFGPGWALWLPFSLVVLQSGKRAEVLTDSEQEQNSAPVLVVHDYVAHRADFYRAIGDYDPRGRARFCRVTAQASSKEGISYEYDPLDYLWKDGDSFTLEREGRQYYFNPYGSLLEIRRDDFALVRYIWENGLIVRLSDGFDRAYNIWYEQSEWPRVTKIVPDSGNAMRYVYNSEGYLVRCDGGKNEETYGYDSRGCLTEVKTERGKGISRIVYDDSNAPVSALSDTVTDASGGTVARTFEQGRVASLQDMSGAIQRVTYGARGELSMVQIGDQAGAIWQLRYDSGGRLCSLRDPRARTIGLQYDEYGRVSTHIGPRGETQSFQMDDSGRVKSVIDQDGRAWDLAYDSQGNLRETRGSDNSRWRFEYRNGVLVKIDGPAGRSRAESKKGLFEMKTTAKNGFWWKLVWNHSGQLTEYQTRGASCVRFKYEDDGRSLSILSEAGIIRHDLDPRELALTVSFEGL